MERYNDELRKAGALLSLDGLHAPSRGALVSFSGGRATVTDGPFAETRECLGGYYLVNARNLDEAIDIAGRIPGARKGTVEIRPVLEIPNLPAAGSAT